MQVCSPGCVLSWKKWVYFVDYLSWLLPMAPSVYLSRERSCIGRACMEAPRSQEGSTSPRCLGSTLTFTPGLVWPTVLKEWWLLASCGVLNFDTINIWSQIISYCQGLSLALQHVSQYPYLHLLNTKSTSNNQKVSRHCQMSLKDKTDPSWELPPLLEWIS